MASLSGLSASVTRILSVTGFAKELKTKDIQGAFAEWEGAGGGFKIKWRDDTSLLVVFQDPAVAKRAYLSTLARPPAVLCSGPTPAVVRPYDGPDAQTIIQTVNARSQHAGAPSRRAQSISIIAARAAGPRSAGAAAAAATGAANGAENDGREPSPTLPSLPSHPTLNALISSSLGEAVAGDAGAHADGVAASPVEGAAGGGPRIGDPGRRMLGAALGVRAPGLGPRRVNGAGGEHGVREVQRAMGGLVVAE